MNISSRPFKTSANVEYLKFKIIWKLKFSKVHIFESSKIIPGKSLNILNFYKVWRISFESFPHVTQLKTRYFFIYNKLRINKLIIILFRFRNIENFENYSFISPHYIYSHANHSSNMNYVSQRNNIRAENNIVH